MAQSPVRVSLACLIAFGSACSTPTSPDGTSGASVAAAATPSSNVASALIDLTNAERRRAGLPSLAANNRLMQAAQIQADQNASAGRLEHVSSGARYPRVEDRLAAVGYRWSTYGENLAYGQHSPSATMQSWMGSSGHRGNILNSSFTELGIGYALDRSGRPYYSQVFGRPAS
jgi:uncharacterized protein YkwD